MSVENETLVTDMGYGKLSSTQTQTAVFQSSGNISSLSSINAITEYYSKGIVNNDEFEYIYKGRGNDSNCTEYTMGFCNDKKYNFMLLLNDPFISSDPISEFFFQVKKVDQRHAPLKILAEKRWILS